MASAWAAMLGPPASSARRCRTSRASAGGSRRDRRRASRARQTRPEWPAHLALAAPRGGLERRRHPRRPGRLRWSVSAACRLPQRSRRTSLTQHGLHHVVEHRRLVAQHRQRLQHVVLRGRMQRQSRPQHAARGGRVRRVLPPRQAVRTAIRRGLRARHPQQRPDDPPRALGHAEQGAPARRGQQPVEDGLGLVGGGVADGDQRVPLPRHPLRLRVAHRPRPRLHVSFGRAGAVHEQLDPERRAERAAVRLVGVGLRPAQAVVDVQRALDVVAGTRCSRQVESRPPLNSDEQLHRVARNSAVASSKPLSLTSPIGWKDSRRPAASATSRVTSTSPPVARAPTREARLTERP